MEGKQQGMDIKKGSEKLAAVILKEIVKRSDKDLVLDLGDSEKQREPYYRYTAAEYRQGRLFCPCPLCLQRL